MKINIMQYAFKAHANVNHLYNDNPYSVHLVMVAYFANKYIDLIPDQCRQTVIDACWLHDTIEDCRLTYNDVKNVAGADVADIVYAVTNEKGKNRKERANDKYYVGIRNTAWASFVKMCDRLANVSYSIQSKSKMLDMYRNENEYFTESLFGGKSKLYDVMVNELNEMLKTK